MNRITTMTIRKKPEYTKDNIEEYWDLYRLWPSVVIQLVNDALIEDNLCTSPSVLNVRTSARAFFQASSGELAEHRELILSCLGFDPDKATKAILDLISSGTTQKDILKIRDSFEKQLRQRTKQRRQKERVT